MKTASFASLALVALTLTGCENVLDSEGMVELTPTAARFVAGGTADLILSNHSSATIFPEFCSPHFERRTDAVWVDMSYPELPCTAPDPFFPGVRPGQSLEVGVFLREDLFTGIPLGEYRVRPRIRDADGVDLDVVSTPFEVEAAAP